LTEERFLELVDEALSEIPEEFVSYMENVEVAVEQYPSLELLRDMGLSSTHTLYGVYRGVPFKKRGKSWSPLFPDQIIVFQKPIEYACGGHEGRIREQIRRTVLHEVGHFFGFSERKLRELGY
jgi:predicted Zn-dependent protease with MMP-like domain